MVDIYLYKENIPDFYLDFRHLKLVIPNPENFESYTSSRQSFRINYSNFIEDIGYK